MKGEQLFPFREEPLLEEKKTVLTVAFPEKVSIHIKASPNFTFDCIYAEQIDLWLASPVVKSHLNILNIYRVIEILSFCSLA